MVVFIIYCNINPRTFVNNSRITRVKRVGSQQNFQYPLIYQFDTCHENLDPLNWQVTELRRHISGHVGTKSADFAIYRIWASFIAFWSILSHSRQHHWWLWISRRHIQLPLGQGHTRSQVPWSVFLAHFSHHNSMFIPALSLQVIV